MKIKNVFLQKNKKSFFVLFLFLFQILFLGKNTFAVWTGPTQSPPSGNIPGPVWLSQSTSQDGFLNLSSSNESVITANGNTSIGVHSFGKEYGVIGSGEVSGVRGIGIGASSYGIFGQGSLQGYSAGFDGPVVLVPKKEELKVATQGTIYYNANLDSGTLYFCSLKNGCSQKSDWEDLVYGAFLKNGVDIFLAKPEYTLNSSVDSNFYINSDKNLQLRFNKNNNSDSSSFNINNGENKTVFKINEDGNVELTGNLILGTDAKIVLNGVAIASWKDILQNQNNPVFIKDNTNTDEQKNTSSSQNSQIDQTNSQNNTTQPNQQNTNTTTTQKNIGGNGSAQGGNTTQNNNNTQVATQNNNKNNQPILSGVTLNGAYNWGGNGLGRIISAESGPVTISSSKNNALEVNSVEQNGIAGYFSSGASGSIGNDSAIFANGSTAGFFNGLSFGINANCSGENCIGVNIANSGGGNGIGLLVNSTSGYSAKFTGQEVIFGNETTNINTQKISNDGDVYVKRNLEIDGELCLGNFCSSSFVINNDWVKDSNGVLSSSAQKNYISETALVAGSSISANYPLTVDKTVLVGLSNGNLDTGLLINGFSNSKSILQAYSSGAGNVLSLNPTGGRVSIGADTQIDVANGDGDLFVKGDIEVEGSICFKTASGCKSAWPTSSSGGGGGSSAWVIDTINSYIYDFGAQNSVVYKIGIGTQTPQQVVDINGGLKVGNTSTNSSGSIRYNGTNFQGYTGSSWVQLDNVSGSTSFWEDGTNGVYEDDKAVIVGTDVAETLSDSNFGSSGGGMNAGDLFVANELGVESTIFTDQGVTVGNNLVTLSSTNLTKNTGDLTINSVDGNINIIPGGGVTDYFNVDSGVFIVDSQLNTVGVGMQPDTWTKFSVNAGSVGGITSLTTGNFPGITVSATGGGNGVTIFSEGVGSTGLSVVSTNTFAITASSTNGIGAQITTSSLSNEALLASGAGVRTAKFMNGSVVIGTSGVEHFVDGDGDLYIKDEFEVDGPSYFDTTPAVTPNFVSGSGDVFIGDVLEVEGNVHLGSAGKSICINRAGTCGTPYYPIHVGLTGTDGNGAYLSGGGVWTDISSKTKKDRFYEVEKSQVLQKILGLSVTGWYYKGTNENHIGPVAEDFYNLFNTGNDEKALAPGDVAGVALIGIQELATQVSDLKLKLEVQEKTIQNLIKRIEKLEEK